MAKLHSAKKYVVQYGTHISFGVRDQEEVMDALYHFLQDKNISYNGDCFSYSEDFEIIREDLIEVIDKIRQSKEQLLKNSNNQFFADELQRLLDQADPDDDWIHFSWF